MTTLAARCWRLLHGPPPRTIWKLEHSRKFNSGARRSPAINCPPQLRKGVHPASRGGIWDLGGSATHAVSNDDLNALRGQQALPVVDRSRLALRPVLVVEMEKRRRFTVICIRVWKPLRALHAIVVTVQHLSTGPTMSVTVPTTTCITAFFPLLSVLVPQHPALSVPVVP